MDGSNLIVLEWNPDTGKMEPVSPEQIREETQGWTTPPEGLPARQFGAWRLARKRALAEGIAPDIAWYRACAITADAEARFADKARRRFFRP